VCIHAPRIIQRIYLLGQAARSSGQWSLVLRGVDCRARMLRIQWCRCSRATARQPAENANCPREEKLVRTQGWVSGNHGAGVVFTHTRTLVYLDLSAVCLSARLLPPSRSLARLEEGRRHSAGRWQKTEEQKEREECRAGHGWWKQVFV